MTTPVSQDTDQLRLLLADILDVEPERLTDDARFTEDLGIDSVLALEVALTLERRHGVRISEAEIKASPVPGRTQQVHPDREDPLEDADGVRPSRRGSPPRTMKVESAGRRPMRMGGGSMAGSGRPAAAAAAVQLAVALRATAPSTSRRTTPLNVLIAAQ